MINVLCEMIKWFLSTYNLIIKHQFKHLIGQINKCDIEVLEFSSEQQICIKASGPKQSSSCLNSFPLSLVTKYVVIAH